MTRFSRWIRTALEISGLHRLTTSNQNLLFLAREAAHSKQLSSWRNERSSQSSSRMVTTCMSSLRSTSSTFRRIFSASAILRRTPRRLQMTPHNLRKWPPTIHFSRSTVPCHNHSNPTRRRTLIPSQPCMSWFSYTNWRRRMRDKNEYSEERHDSNIHVVF